MKNSPLHMEDAVWIDVPIETAFAFLTDFHQVTIHVNPTV